MVKSYPEILALIERGEAVVMTSQEVSRLVETGEKAALAEVDVVTTATRAVMSGTYAVLSFPVARPGVFLRAKRVFINDIAASVGPCPNENLGVLDLISLWNRSQPEQARLRRRPSFSGPGREKESSRRG